ncbi:unnamed protein product (macronuclear) [Paramecium tetraurelia]|uniref:RING-type domain-containing protein n=1 Tax=Paramecium tetraurelia TaxID=5888 RepID=A0BWD1_PARTE|nr:uncharacterized protein GSPATT00032700001 [Paramecium tetraurelia]CAK62848.1 unnamed protein product [Paramecium tetraurelia]|eukprot:XP_001430246.1 hypothetical protein (macronuclear) [Paramecium tetraurelia strain d4-2]
MDCCFIICPCCQIQVGFLNCCTCHKQYEWLQCNGLPVACPICVNVSVYGYFKQIKLDTYYQSDEDVALHRNCYKNYKRMYYHCQCCDGYFCTCVQDISTKTISEKQLKKKIVLHPCPLFKRKV